MDIMSFNPDLNKQAQEVVFSKKMTKLFTHICFYNAYIHRNLSEWEIEFLLSYLVKNVQLTAKNGCHYKTISKLSQHSLITT